MGAVVLEGLKRKVAKRSRIARRATVRLLERAYEKVAPQREYSPEIEVLGDSLEVITKLLATDLERHRGRAPTYLDVGGRKGERAGVAAGYQYLAMDLEPRAEHVVVGDICRCPEIPDNSYAAVASYDVFEHLQRPWDAARECIRICKPGGLLVHRTLFAYRYHPIPIDYWRFTSQGLEYLFTNDGRVETVCKGYDLRKRRTNHVGWPMHGNRDVPPIDFWGGFRENWLVLFVGRKRG